MLQCPAHFFYFFFFYKKLYVSSGYRAAPSMLQTLAYLFYFQTIILVIVWRYKKGVLFTRFAPGTRPESPSPILAARSHTLVA